MRVTMVKKRFQSGETCQKCIQAEELLKARNLWHHIDQVAWAIEGDPSSEGMKLAARLGIELAPFFVVRDESGNDRVYESVLALIKKELSGAADPRSAPAESPTLAADEVAELAARHAERSPIQLVDWALTKFGADCGIAFSGAEDVVLIDIAAKTGLKYSVFTLDTGRLHPETLRYIDRVRSHYGIDIAVMSPDAASVEDLVRKKGLFSFYQDGHHECCGIRKVEPLGRALAGLKAWITGQRRDQSPATRSAIAAAELDHPRGRTAPLLKLNPLANWSSAQVWAYIDEHEVPFNPLHERGFRSIGCEPCTRAVLPHEHERAGRWWWEEATKRECGLHIRGASSEED
jgi:phosphoadenosine phosphosulfate reductase